MRVKIKKDWLIIFIYILSGLMVIGQFFGVSSITSFSFALSFIIIFILWCLSMKEVRIFDLLAILIIALSFVSTIATYTSLSIGYFINWVTFSFVFLYFSVCLKIRLETKTIETLFRINLIVAIFAGIAYFLRFDDVFYITNIGMKYLKYDFYNPNTAAIFLFCIAVTGILKFFFSDRTSLVKQILFIGLFLFLIFQTLSRTVMIAIVFFIVVYFIFKRKGRYFLPKGVLFCLIVSVFPLIFSVAYIKFINSSFTNEFFSFLVNEGKLIDSRQVVWEYAFDLFREYPIFGAYGHILSSSFFSQMHNSHLNVLASYGVIVFTLVIVYIFIIMKKITANSKSNHSELSVWAFIVCLLLGSGEAILFSGGLSFYLFAGQFLFLSNAPTENAIGIKRQSPFRIKWNRLISVKRK